MDILKKLLGGSTPLQSNIKGASSVCNNFASMSTKIKLCLSTKPFDHGDSAAVVWITMLNYSHKAKNSLFTNSTLLSLKNLSAGPLMEIQLVRRASMITRGCLEGICKACDSHVA